MYKSILGAIGLFSLLLLLCASDPASALAATAHGKMQITQVAPVQQRVVTDTFKATSFFTNQALYADNFAIQNQQIVEVLPSASSLVLDELRNNNFDAQIIFERDANSTYILATKPLEGIQTNIQMEVDYVLKQVTEKYYPPDQVELYLKNDPASNLPSVQRANLASLLIGNPHGIGAMPFGKPIGGSTIITTVVLRQWALSSLTNTVGMNLYDQLGISRSITATGKGVRIVFFDTSPFTFPQPEGEASYTGVFETPFQVVGHERLALTVTNASPTQPFTRIFTTTNTITHSEEHEEHKPIDISSHGLFAAGLAYAVAPDAEIELVQVLDSYGQASLGDLVQAIQWLTSTHSTQPTILNLSLSVLQDLPPESSEIQLLQAAISATQKTGIIVVASAGNRPIESPTATMKFPAAYPDVIGVAASNAIGNVACFSRYEKANGYKGIAPGGDANVDSAPNECIPAAAIRSCINELFSRFLWAFYYRVNDNTIPVINYNCSDMLIGLTFDPHTGDASQTGEYHYGYWMGTSFAAPIVSGLLALELESNRSLERIYPLLNQPTPIAQEGKPLPKVCPLFIDARITTKAISCGIILPDR